MCVFAAESSPEDAVVKRETICDQSTFVPLGGYWNGYGAVTRVESFEEVSDGRFILGKAENDENGRRLTGIIADAAKY